MAAIPGVDVPLPGFPTCEGTTLATPLCGTGAMCKPSRSTWAIPAASNEQFVNGAAFWNGKRVLLTGHTGFKGGWLSLWLGAMGARVTGYALAPPTDPHFFGITRVGDSVRSVIGDILDRQSLAQAFAESEPEIVFHLAAQPIVRAVVPGPGEHLHDQRHGHRGRA